jgi:putative FmdB family regulatory protein
MPFYEYECGRCGYHGEVLQQISDPPLKKCPSCGKGGLRKLISAPVFRLKGSGWYETDFKSDKENKRNLAGADKEEADKKAEPKTDAKPEAKPETPKAESAKPAEDKPAAKPVKRAATRPSVKNKGKHKGAGRARR